MKNFDETENWFIMYTLSLDIFWHQNMILLDISTTAFPNFN